MSLISVGHLRRRLVYGADNSPSLACKSKEKVNNTGGHVRVQAASWFIAEQELWVSEKLRGN